MTPHLSPERIAEIRAQMRELTAHATLRLHLGSRLGGGHFGSASGSSTEYLDHRPYAPGDDPRHLDWSAFARTGHHTLNLYQEEVRPMVDLALDSSASMRLTPSKQTRAAELLFFVIESSLRNGASLRIHSLDTPEQEPVSDEPYERCLNARTESPAPPRSEPIPWRTRSSRIVVSDLLFAVDPLDLLARWSSGAHQVVILAPFSSREAAPDWMSNVRLKDVETGDGADRRFSPSDLERYRNAYETHFENWQYAAASRGAVFARIPDESSLQKILTQPSPLTELIDFK